MPQTATEALFYFSAGMAFEPSPLLSFTAGTP